MASVLIVDDELSIVESLAEILDWAGYEVLTAANGQEALAALDKKPDVIVCDFMMPVLDGAQFLRTLRADRRHRAIPVIMMSAAREANVRAAAKDSDRKLSWDAFIQKPFSPDELLALLASMTRRGRR